jgi:hypothetical protein
MKKKLYLLADPWLDAAVTRLALLDMRSMAAMINRMVRRYVEAMLDTDLEFNDYMAQWEAEHWDKGWGEWQGTLLRTSGKRSPIEPTASPSGVQLAQKEETSTPTASKRKRKTTPHRAPSS